MSGTAKSMETGHPFPNTSFVDRSRPRVTACCSGGFVSCIQNCLILSLLDLRRTWISGIQIRIGSTNERFITL